MGQVALGVGGVGTAFHQFISREAEEKHHVQIQPYCAAFNYERCKTTYYKTWELLYTNSNL